MTESIHTIEVESQLCFTDNVFPQIIANQQGFEQIHQVQTWVQANLSDIEQQLDRSGAVLFRGFPLHNADTFDTFCMAFGYTSFTYQESLSNAVRINYTERVFTANEAPKEVEIFLHHEMAQTPISPEKLFFFCQHAAETGGETPICRSDQLYRAIANKRPELAARLERLGVLYTTNMPKVDDSDSGQGRSWMGTLSVDSINAAEKKLAALGYTWQWLDDGSLNAITPVLPAVLTLHSGVKVFYNQLVAAYMGWQGVRDNPSKALSYGDGTPIAKHDLELIASQCEQFTFDLKWQDGDVVLIDNKMVMHGRRPYGGERKRLVLVALAA